MFYIYCSIVTAKDSIALNPEMIHNIYYSPDLPSICYLFWKITFNHLFQDVPEFEHMTVTTENDEQYKCFIPHLTEKEKDNHEKYNGPNPLDLLAPLFAQKSCSIRVSILTFAFHCIFMIFSWCIQLICVKYNVGSLKCRMLVLNC